MALTDTAIRGARAQTGRTIKLSDGGGLQLWVTPTGSKLWTVAYRFNGRQLKLSLGPYPAVGLKDARAQRDAAKRLLASGIDPGQQKKTAALTKANAEANTFDAIAAELLDKKRREAKAGSHLGQIGMAPEPRQSRYRNPSNRRYNSAGNLGRPTRSRGARPA